MENKYLQINASRIVRYNRLLEIGEEISQEKADEISSILSSDEYNDESTEGFQVLESYLRADQVLGAEGFTSIEVSVIGINE